MKKILLIMFSLLVYSTSLITVEAKSFNTPEVTSAIRMYKARNYTECYTNLQQTVKKDPSNALAYYYLAMSSAQLGRKDEAISNYDKVLSLSATGNLKKYAFQGKICLEDYSKCLSGDNASSFDKFINRKYNGLGFSDKVQTEYEKQKIDNIKREMNRNTNIDPNKFKDYKDYSSAVPTNDEIVAAIRVLQRAGMSDIMNRNAQLDLSMISENPNKINNQMFGMFSGNDMSNMSPQLIQSLLTSQMSTGF